MTWRHESIIEFNRQMGDWLGPVRRGQGGGGGGEVAADGSVVTWGTVLEKVVAVDAFLVLAGSVLTSYVGLGGLLR